VPAAAKPPHGIVAPASLTPNMSEAPGSVHRYSVMALAGVEDEPSKVQSIRCVDVPVICDAEH
jgi:hypothetical protein